MKSSDKIWIPNPNFITNFQSSISSPTVYLWMYCWCSCAYVFLVVCVLACFCTCLLTAEFYVCLLIDIYMVAHKWWDKEVCTVCVRVSWSAPPLACLTSHSTWTKAVHSTCLLTGSHSWAARARGREAPANSQSASTLLSARARTNLRPSLAFQVEPARSAVRLLVRDVSERVGWSWVVDSTSWPSSVFLARVRPAAVQRVRLSFCSQLSSRSMEPRLSQGKNVKNVLLLWSCSIQYNGLHSNSMAEIKPLISSHNQLEYNK